jgi:hypothetical protein
MGVLAADPACRGRVRVVAATPLAAELRTVPGVASIGDPVRSTDGTLVRTDVVLTAPAGSGEARATVQRFPVAVAVLLDAMLVRLILVPALALDLGRWFWWPGTPSPASITQPSSRAWVPIG